MSLTVWAGTPRFLAKATGSSQNCDGDEVVIMENDQPAARLVPTQPIPKKAQRQLGTMKGTVLYMAPDFDAPLEDFKEYMD